MKTQIIFRADGGTLIGMGHIVRCLALAEMLTNDFEIIFAIQQPAYTVLKTIETITKKIIYLPITTDYIKDAFNFSKQINQQDIIVLDGYNFKTDYQKTIKAVGCKLVCIDDLHTWHQIADVIINHAGEVDVSEYSMENYTKTYLGLEYVLLRKPFLEIVTIKREKISVKTIFISMGAADEKNLTHKFVEALLPVQHIAEIHLMLGSINTHLKSIDDLIANNSQISINKHFNISAVELSQLLKKCDVAICPSSSISLECCATGIGLLSGYTASNQTAILDGLIKSKAAINLGDMNAISIDEITSSINQFITQPKVINDLIKNQEKLVDGKSPERLLKIFKELVKQNLTFRLAIQSDVDLYFKWANDSVVRANSFNQNTVSYAEHIKWFQSKLEFDDCKLYLFLNDEKKSVGQVRIDKNREEIVIGISVDENFRGQSLSIEMLCKATSDYFRQHPQAEITAYIKKENNASLNAFLKAGFTNQKIVMQHHNESYKLSKKLKL